jgi:hypothetical protein
MNITRMSPLNGRINTMDLPITQAQLDEFYGRTTSRTIQQIFPDLNATQREFIKTGYTQEDWDAIFPAEKG